LNAIAIDIYFVNDLAKADTGSADYVSAPEFINSFRRQTDTAGPLLG